ncbi:MAG: hypothetical protein ABEJ97_06785 [Halobellus sp.]
MTSLARARTTLLAALCLTAGCLGGVPTDDPLSSPTTEPGTYGASEQPDPDKEVRVENAWNRTVDLRVRVVRVATGETVYDENLTVEPGAERVVYNTSEANPDGIESFRVVATARNTTKRVTIETNACYGNVYVEITEEGELYPYYAIC